MIRIRDGAVEFEVDESTFVMELYRILPQPQKAEVVRRLCELHERNAVPVPTIEVSRIVGDGQRF